MAKGTRGRRGFASRQCRPLPASTLSEDMRYKKCSNIFEKKVWEDATCSVCMEYPHNVVLLLCSSHDRGCHPYMCGTSFRYSNCLNQYKKAYTKVISPNHSHTLHGSVDSLAMNTLSSCPVDKCEVTELACPLCRGQVKGWTVVEPAREYLNAKKRTCMRDNCSFIGTFKELRKHVKAEHPSARPWEVDPVLEQKWSSLEREREREDVISTIRSSLPNAVVFGDYVIEGTHYGFNTNDESFDELVMQRDGFDVGVNSIWLNVFLLLQALGSTRNGVPNRGTTRRRHEREPDSQLDEGAIRSNLTIPVGNFDSDQDSDSHDNIEGDTNDRSLVGCLRRQGQVLIARSGRRRRRRETNGDR